MTATSERLAARIEELPEGSLRRQVLESARRFKASWVELARHLVKVRRAEHWRGWGYPSFEQYCSKELFIRKQTAEKLVASFGFLERHEPAMARPRAEPAAPPFEVIEVLSRAEAAGRFSEDGWRELRDEVIERTPTPAAVNRRLAERFGPPPAARPGRPERLQRLATAARRVAELAEAERGLPPGLAARAAKLADELAALTGTEG